jgi:D-alanyl-D-alanine carboxypeptidase/D-alanyl-D-alanine-endopeptidase (penicillin-binding protein 4)
MLRLSVIRSITAVVCLGAVQSAVAQDAALRAKVEALLADPSVARAHWGVHVTKLNGTPILGINEGQFFQPASNNKMFTTATAMALLPIDQSLTTTITTANAPVGGVVRGDVVLHGVGDANFSAREIPYVTPSLRPKVSGTPPVPNELRFIDEMADQMKAAGVTRVTGDVVGDDTLMPWDPYAADWSIDDALWYYGAPINALMIADNAINLKIAPGLKPGDAAVVMLNPALPYYTVENNITTVAKGVEAHTDIQRSVLVSGGSRVLRLYGTIAIGVAPQTEDIAIEDPAEYAARALKAALEARGVAVTGVARAKHWIDPTYTFTREATQPVPDLQAVTTLDCAMCAKATAGTVLAKHVGSSLYDDVVWTNKISQNQHAEMFLHLLGQHVVGKGSTAQGVRVVRSFLTTRAGIDPDDFVFYDGSGLSGHDLVTPRAITQLLRYAATQPWGARWKASLPVAGEDGGLRARYASSPLKDHVYAKTGTLGEVHALSGYVDCVSGQTVVFSVISNAHTPRTNVDMQVLDKVVAAIAESE